LSRTKSRTRRRTRATNHCRHFDSTALAHCARAGLTALEAAHQGLITDPTGTVGCSICLDSCRQHLEPDVHRWDYVLTLKQKPQPGLGVEVHHAAATEIDSMISKKEWAEDLLAEHCPDLDVGAWCWLIPPGGHALFLRGSSHARRLATNGIAFPRSDLKF